MYIYLENNITGHAIKKEPLKIGVVVWGGYAPFYVAEEMGFFSEEGVDVRFVRIDPINYRSVMKTGRVDAIGVPSDIVQLINDADIKVRAVMNIDVSDGGDGIIAKHSIKSIKDLKGKKIAFEPGSTSHFFLLYTLSKVGLTTADIKKVSTTVPDAGMVFLAGEVDAAVTWEPWLSQAAELNKGHILASTKGTAIINDLLIFREEIVSQRPNDIKSFIRAHFKGLNYIKTNPEESQQIMLNEFGVNQEDLELMLSGMRWFSYEENLDYFGISGAGIELKRTLDQAGDFWLQEGIITTKANPNAIIDKEILRTAYG